jgi:hypothetical protein
MTRSFRRVVLAAALLMGGCGTATFIVQQYDGKPLPRERIALLRINGGSALRLESLDGERLNYELKGLDNRVHIEMLPGVHEIGVSDPEDGLLQVRRFRAQPGKVYRPALIDAPQAGGRLATRVFALFEVSADDDQVLAELPDYPEAVEAEAASSAPPALSAVPLAPNALTTELPAATASVPGAPSISAAASQSAVPSVAPSVPAAMSAAPVASVPVASVPVTSAPVPAVNAPAAAPSASSR